VVGREFSIGVPAGWTADAAARATKQEYYKKVMVSGYTLVGACMMFYRSPAKDAYIMVTCVDSPLPLTVDRVITGSTIEMLTERFPGWKQIKYEIVDTKKLNGIIWFTDNDGTGLQLQHLNLVPQVWAITIIGKGAGYNEATFRAMLDSFKDNSSLL
jgi:hypothetical protein